MNGYWKAYVELGNKSYDEAREIFIKLAPQSDCVVWYLHPSGKMGKGPHFHALIQNGKKTDETFRNALKKEFGVSGTQFGVSNNYKKGMKMTELTIDKYVTYMTKGIHEPFYNKGFDEGYLTEKKLQWVEPAAASAAAGLGDVIVNIIGEGKAKRITQFTIAQLAYAKYSEDNIRTENDYNSDDMPRVNKRKLIKIIGQLCQENRMTRNYRTVANIAQDVWCSISPTDWENRILSMI